MTVRDELYLSLIKELLGPRSSIDEIIRDDPREEYITGVLEPVGVERRNLLDYGIADIDGIISEEEGEEDADEATDYFQTNPVTTTLHPLARPKSMGISFLVSSPNGPSINFCVTWARYKKHSGGWKREPRYYISNSIELNKKLDPIKPKVDPEVLIYLRTVPRGKNKSHVSLYLVNNTEFDKNAGTSHMIFQPQIRVNVNSGTKLEPMEYEKIEGEDEQQLSMLYKDLSAYARGHLCGAVWNQIDPARPLTNSEIHSKLISADILNIPESDQRKFMVPDVRTEFLPSYSIDQSTVGLNDLGNFERDDFNTAVISERWDSEVLTRPFRQLIKLYEKWITSKEDILEKKNLPESQIKLLQNNLIKCRQSLERIKQGISLLETDENVKLAFLFMNKVIDTQYQWYRNGSNLIWRPFQISFILQCIQGVANPSSPDRDICDLLWYPTGGGKTEAYMGLIIFCLALRRLRVGNDFDSGAGTGVISRYTLRLLTIQQFRRALRAIVAADYLRVVDWSPKQMPSKVSPLWGEQRFSIGLWVGESVTPNNLVTRNGWDNTRKARIRYPGAIDILMNRHRESPVQGEIISRDTMGEPAQVIKCPCCSTILAIPSAGIVGSQHELYWIIKSDSRPKIVPQDLTFHPFSVTDVQIMSHLPNKEFYVLYVRFSTSEEMITDDKIREWWKKRIQYKVIGRLASCTASRPGYFIRYSTHVHRNPIDFEVHCPNPSCTLATTQWHEKVPSNDNNIHLNPIDTFRSKENDFKWHGVPISAFTVDAQIYAKCPS